MDGWITPEEAEVLSKESPEDFVQIGEIVTSRCSAIRSGGGRCNATALAGISVCRHHAKGKQGSTEMQVRRTTIAASIADERVENPHTRPPVADAIFEELEAARLMTRALRRMVMEQGHTQTVTTFSADGAETTTEVESVEIRLLGDQEKRYHKLLVDASKLGLEIRQVELVKRQSDLLVLFAKRIGERFDIEIGPTVALDVLRRLADIDPDEELSFVESTT